MNDEGETFVAKNVRLDSGIAMPSLKIRYKRFGKLNVKKDNCMVVCHALTGNQAVDSWWKEIFGPGKLLDPNIYMIVCANVLGSCYGSSGPTSIDPATGKPYGSTFPDTTIRDTVNLHVKLVREHLGVKRVACVIGGSMGGMQALEWGAICGSDYVRSIITMCCGTHHHAWQIGISETQRQAIYMDPNWRGGTYLDAERTASSPPLGGLAIARQIAMVSYRSHAAYEAKFGRRVVDEASSTVVEAENRDGGQKVRYDVESYLRYQGQKFLGRFDPLSYVKCTRSMDSHDLGLGRGESAESVARSRITMPALVVSISSDGLYPPCEQRALHRALSRSEYLSIESDNGHDGFLLDHERIMPVAIDFLRRNLPRYLHPVAKGGAAREGTRSVSRL